MQSSRVPILFNTDRYSFDEQDDKRFDSYESLNGVHTHITQEYNQNGLISAFQYLNTEPAGDFLSYSLARPSGSLPPVQYPESTFLVGTTPQRTPSLAGTVLSSPLAPFPDAHGLPLPATSRDDFLLSHTSHDEVSGSYRGQTQLGRPGTSWTRRASGPSHSSLPPVTTDGWGQIDDDHLSSRALLTVASPAVPWGRDDDLLLSPQSPVEATTHGLPWSPPPWNSPPHLVGLNPSAVPRPHVCNICSKGFAKRNDLRRHRGTVHQSGGELVFRCRCKYKCTRKDNYLRHMRPWSHQTFPLN